MTGDVRGWRVAIVADELINARPADRPPMVDVLGLLEVGGFGVLQLPPAGEHALLLAVVADQIAEYAHHGYAVVAVGLLGEPGNGLHWRRLAPLLRHRRVATPPRHLIRPDVDSATEDGRLADFLSGCKIPLMPGDGPAPP